MKCHLILRKSWSTTEGMFFIKKVAMPKIALFGCSTVCFLFLDIRDLETNQMNIVVVSDWVLNVPNTLLFTECKLIEHMILCGI